MSSINKCPRKGKEIYTLPSPNLNLSGGSSLADNPIRGHQVALQDTAMLDFDQIMLVHIAKNSFRAGGSKYYR